MEDNKHMTTPDHVKTEKRSPRYLVFIFIISFIAITILYVVKRDVVVSDHQAGMMDRQPEMVITPTAVISLAPSIPKSQIMIEVLNGSGVKGKAKEIADLLEQNGYTIVRTGNADAFSYKGVTIRVAAQDTEILSLLMNDLKNTYTIASTSAGESLGKSMVQIIVGE